MTKAKKDEKPKAPKFRYFKCEGAAFELLKAYREELGVLAENHIKLHEEFQERAATLQKHHQGNLRSMWVRLSGMVGLDPKTTWANPEYQIEVRYLEDGFGAILYTPQPRGGALQELLGDMVEPQPEEEDDPFGEVVPDKSRLN